MALTSFLTGITEPIEFAFMFLAPALYALHAVLTGAALVVMNMLGVKLGFGFSVWFIDYVINFGMPRNLSTSCRSGLPISSSITRCSVSSSAGLTCALSAEKRDPASPGWKRPPHARRPLQACSPRSAGQPTCSTWRPRTPGCGWPGYLACNGQEFDDVEATDTRLRLALADAAVVDRARLMELGAFGFERAGEGTLDVVFGLEAASMAAALAEERQAAGTAPSAPLGLPRQGDAPGGRRPEESESERLIAALGEPGNIAVHGVGVRASRGRGAMGRATGTPRAALPGRLV